MTSHARLSFLVTLVLTSGEVDWSRLAATGVKLGPVAAAQPPLAIELVSGSTKNDVTVATDLYGDPLPEGAVARLGTTRLRHGGHVSCVAFSPDGGTLASGGGDNVVRLWDASTGKLLRVLRGHEDRVMSVDFSPDGKIVASSGTNDGTIRLWEVATGKEMRRLEPKTSITFVRFAPDGTTLASGTWNKAVYLWDIKTGRQLRRWEAHAERIFRAAFSPDGNLLATTGWEDKTACLWDVDTGKKLREFGQGITEMCAVGFSADGKTLAGGGKEGPIYLWDVSSGKETSRLVGHDGFVESVVFSKDGRTLFSGSYDRTVRMWDLKSRKELHPPGRHFDLIYGISLSPDGKTLASAGQDNLVRRWDVATGREISREAGHEHAILALAFGADRRTLISTARDGTIRTWQTDTGKELRRVKGPSDNDFVSRFSPDGKILATVDNKDTLHVWNAAEAKESFRFSMNGARNLGLAFSSDGQFLASGDAHKDRSRISVRHLQSGKVLRSFDDSQYGYAELALSPDARFAASVFSTGPNIGGGSKVPIQLWDTLRGKQICELEGHRDWVVFAFSPDGKMLATAGADNHVRLWETASGQERWHGALGENAITWALVFSPDGRSLALTSSGCLWRNSDRAQKALGTETVIRLWEVATGKERHRLAGHAGYARALAFSQDGQLLASGSHDSTVLVWRPDRLPSKEPSEKVRLTAAALEALWNRLASKDARDAYEALCKLATTSGQTEQFLAEHLRPVAVADPDKLVKLIRDLDNERFDVRRKATEELGKLGEAAAGALRKSLDDKTSLEARQRLQALLSKVDGSSPEQLRITRALELLERMNTSAARVLLKSLASGVEGAHVTQEAQACLRRLELAGRHQP
jgi:WD40 repeat protein